MVLCPRLCQLRAPGGNGQGQLVWPLVVIKFASDVCSLAQKAATFSLLSFNEKINVTVTEARERPSHVIMPKYGGITVERT